MTGSRMLSAAPMYELIVRPIVLNGGRQERTSRQDIQPTVRHSLRHIRLTHYTSVRPVHVSKVIFRHEQIIQES